MSMAYLYISFDLRVPWINILSSNVYINMDDLFTVDNNALFRLCIYCKS